MKIVIIGAGLIGCERIEAIQYITKATFGEIYIAAVFDTNTELLQKVEKKYNIPIVYNINDAMKLNPDWVFICTSNDAVCKIAELSFAAKANVLIEKPLGRTLNECKKIISFKPEHLKLNVGFNYRFFAGVEAVINDAKYGKFGKIISVNLILGHGNAPGMEKSWHLDPIKRGSVVADLGVHLFDLILQISPNQVNMNYAKFWSGFWNTGINEEAHMILSNKDGAIFNAQVSFNRWRSIFKLEINGTEGYGVVEGRGRSHGSQSYRTGVRWGWLDGKTQKDSETIVINEDNCDNSFIKETISVLGLSNKLNNISTSMPCIHTEALNVMSLLEEYNTII